MLRKWHIAVVISLVRPNGQKKRKAPSWGRATERVTSRKVAGRNSKNQNRTDYASSWLSLIGSSCLHRRHKIKIRRHASSCVHVHELQIPSGGCFHACNCQKGLRRS